MCLTKKLEVFIIFPFQISFKINSLLVSDGKKSYTSPANCRSCCFVLAFTCLYLIWNVATDFGGSGQRVEYIVQSSCVGLRANKMKVKLHLINEIAECTGGENAIFTQKLFKAKQYFYGSGQKNRGAVQFLVIF